MARWWCASTSALLLYALARAAAAQPAEHPITLRWDAPAACPSSDEVLADIDRLLGGRPSASAGKRLTATARVTRAGEGAWELALRTESDGGKGERKLKATSCRPLADAAALIIALGFDPVAVALQTRRQPAADPPAAPGAPPTPAAAPPAVAGPGTPLPPGAAAPAPTPGAPGSPAPGSPAPVPPGSTAAPGGPPPQGWPAPAAPPWSPQPGPVPPWSPQPGPAPPWPQQPGVPPVGWPQPGAPWRPPEPPSPPKRFGAGVAVGGDLGTFAETAVLLRAWASFSHERLRFRADVTYLPPTRTSVPETPDAGGRFSLLAGGLSACRILLPWRAAAVASPFDLSACAGAEVGRLSAEGFGVTDPGEGAALWFAPGATAALTFALPGDAALHLDVGAAVPIGRRRFVLERVGLVHEPSPVVGRGTIGVGVHF